MRYLMILPCLLLVSCMSPEQAVKIEQDLEADRSQRKELVTALEKEREAVTKLRGEIAHIESDYKSAAKAQWERINKAVESIPKTMDKKVEPFLPTDIFGKAMEIWRGELNTMTLLLGKYEAELNAETKNDDRIAQFLALIGKTFAELKVAPLEARLSQHIESQQAADIVKEERLGRLEARAIEAGSKADQAQKTADDTAKTWDDAVVGKIDETSTTVFWMGGLMILLILSFLLYVLRDHIRIPFIGKKKES